MSSKLPKNRFCRELGFAVRVGVYFGDKHAGYKNKHKMARAHLHEELEIRLMRLSESATASTFQKLQRQQMSRMSRNRSKIVQ
jgi:hypothetical protein